MDKCGTKEGHLLIFDRRTSKNWAKSIEEIEVWGC